MKFNALANVIFWYFLYGTRTKQGSWLHVHLFQQLLLLLRFVSANAIQRTRLASNKHCLRLPSFLSLVVSSNQIQCCESWFLRLMAYVRGLFAFAHRSVRKFDVRKANTWNWTKKRKNMSSQGIQKLCIYNITCFFFQCQCVCRWHRRYTVDVSTEMERESDLEHLYRYKHDFSSIMSGQSTPL